jgi:hypothetical protein
MFAELKSSCTFVSTKQSKTKKDMKTANFKFISITANVSVVQESEKAVKVSTLADAFGGRTAIEKEFWFPKSVIQMKDDKMFVASWFAMKCFQENKGIRFDYINNKGLNF